MEFVPVYSYTNYIDANIMLGRLESEGINCWLMDENTNTVNPIWGQAIGGIKIMVAKSDAERAVELLNQFRREQQAKTPCPNCGSVNVDLVSSPRKASTWIGAIFSFLFASYAVAPNKVYHCFKCGHEFKLKEDDTGSDPAFPS
jgi:predicted RNA-binding Zn-ribbon protein involved in translation (DUF1610 family)